MPDKNGDLRCACIQFDVRTGDVEHNLERVETGLRIAAADGPCLAVLPEMWTTSFVDDYDAKLLRRSAAAEERIVELTKELDVLVIGGGPGGGGPQARPYNRALVADRGEVLGEYRKIHLFSPNHEHEELTAGDEPLVVDTRFGRIGVLICYDLRFPELVRWYFQEQCDILAVPAQWPEARADHWRVLCKARAVENEAIVVGCNRTGSAESRRRHDELVVFPGDSRIVEPTGNIVASGVGEEAPITATIDPKLVRVVRRILPVHKDRRPDVYARLWTDWNRGDVGDRDLS